MVLQRPGRALLRDLYVQQTLSEAQEVPQNGHDV